MKKLFLLLCVFCGLYGLSWGDFGESTEGKLCPVTFNHTPGIDCDSARVYFGYPSSNLYISIKLFPLVADSSKLFRDSLNLDSIGGHYAELRYYEHDAGSVSGYLLGEWLHEDPTPGDSNMIYRQTAYVVNDSNVARYVTRDDYKDGVGGTGADTFDIYVFNGDTTAQEGVAITIYNEAHTAVAVPVVTTDVNGRVQIYLDADTYHLYLQRLGVIYAKWDTIVVSNQGIDTIWVASYDPGDPPSANLTRVKGYARDLGYGANERIRITFALHNKNIMDTTQTPAVFVDRKPSVTTFADSFNVDLIPSGSMISKELGVVKDSIKYDVKIEVEGRDILEYPNVFIPGPDTTVWLEDLLE